MEVCVASDLISDLLVIEVLPGMPGAQRPNDGALPLVRPAESGVALSPRTHRCAQRHATCFETQMLIFMAPAVQCIAPGRAGVSRAHLPVDAGSDQCRELPT
jgi:hypothetical protein